MRELIIILLALMSSTGITDKATVSHSESRAPIVREEVPVKPTAPAKEAPVKSQKALEDEAWKNKPRKERPKDAEGKHYMQPEPTEDDRLSEAEILDPPSQDPIPDMD